MSTESALYLIPLCPLIGAILAYVIGTRVHKDLAGWIAVGACLASFGLVVRKFLALAPGQVFQSNVYTWFSQGDLSVDFLLRFDQLTAVMCLVITGIGTLIHLYSVGYMHEDESRPRFFSYLNLFMFSMLLLVLGGNMLVLFVGWEGVGLCSYLLIGFWFKNLNYAAAGRKAFVVNRIGDLGFLLGIFLLYREFGTLDFAELRDAFASINLEAISASFPSLTLSALITIAAACLFVGACGKSAQIPLFVWLPDAMAGPTPVSALIHAATMVTAGVYMMARMSFLFVDAPYALAIVCVVAVVTALVAAVTAMTQNDIKKVLAYSTVSQLGFMFMAAGAGAYWVAVFHLVTHAFFKACLFLTAGSVIHGCHHEQDMRHMGGLYKYMPITTATYAISTLAIAGIFPFAGYQSKHAILAALETSGVHNPFLAGIAEWMLILATFTALLTAFYMTRSFAMTFLGSYRGHHHPHESPWEMTVPLIALAILSAVGGLALGGAFGEEMSLQHYLMPVLQSEVHHHGENIIEALMHSWVGFLGVAVGIVLYTQLKSVPGMVFSAVLPLSKLSLGKFYFDEIYNALIVTPLEKFSAFLWKIFDQGIIDGSVNGTAALVDVTGEVTRTIQTGQIRHYALFMLIATVGLLVFCFLL